MLCLEWAGPGSFEARTRRGGFAGLIGHVPAHSPARTVSYYRVWFNSNATRGSARKFPSVEAAVAYIVARRVKKGWPV